MEKAKQHIQNEDICNASSILQNNNDKCTIAYVGTFYPNFKDAVQISFYETSRSACKNKEVIEVASSWKQKLFAKRLVKSNNRRSLFEIQHIISAINTHTAGGSKSICSA